MEKPIPKSITLEQIEYIYGDVIKTYGRIVRIGKRKDFWICKIRSGSCVEDVQVILKKDKMKKPPTMYSTLQFTAKVLLSPDEKTLELHVLKVLFYGPFDPTDVKVKHGMSQTLLRQQQSQRLLTKRYQMIIFAYQQIEQILHKVSRRNGLLKVRSPFITFSDCEGGGETFEITSGIKNFFKKTAFLTVSGQVDEETITSRLLTPTYIFGPSFRSDPSSTPFHACEFYHYEPEIPFIDLDGLMDLEESIIKNMLGSIIDDDTLLKCMKFLGSDVQSLIEVQNFIFDRISYTEAIKILQKAQSGKIIFEVPPTWGIDLRKEHEKYICEKHFNKPTFIFGYPSEIKSFYMLQCKPFIDTDISDKPLQTCEGVDLLVPGIGELCGGSIREHRYDVLIEQMTRKGLDPKDYKEYLSLRKQGTFPHGGFGMGFDRFIMWILGITHIRDVMPFPRYYGC